MDNPTTSGTTTTAPTSGPPATPAVTTAPAISGNTGTGTVVPETEGFLAGLPEQERSQYFSISPDDNALRISDIRNDEERAAANADYAKQVNEMYAGQAKERNAEDKADKKK